MRGLQNPFLLYSLFPRSHFLQWTVCFCVCISFDLAKPHESLWSLKLLIFLSCSLPKASPGHRPQLNLQREVDASSNATINNSLAHVL